MKFRPCIDIHNGKVKQIVGSTINSANLIENYVSSKDAAHFANMYKEDELKGGHVIMLDKEIETIQQAVLALEAYPWEMQIGGGINFVNAIDYIREGASHIIVNSCVFKNGKIDFDELKQLKRTVGKERLVLDLSCKEKDGKYFVVTDRWKNFTDCEINRENIANLESYCNEFLIHAAHVEGLKKGIDEKLVALLEKCVSIPTTYAGGAKSLGDLALVNELGKGKLDLTIGSALDIFGGNLNYKQVVEWNKRQS